MIYFDNAATTRIDMEVLNAMKPYLYNEYGNPDSKYSITAISAKKALDNSRNDIATFFNCNSNEVVFTSGASEANNFIIKGLIDFRNLDSLHFVTTKIEHASILETHKYLQQLGIKVTYLSVAKNGLINLDELKTVIKSSPTLLTISSVNGEIGTLQDLESIDEICRESETRILVDNTQGISKIKIDLKEYEQINFVTFSSHKIHGPKGIGCAIVKHDKDGIKQKITPLIHGGSQEFRYRGGTSPVHLIVGLSKAIEILSRDFKKNNEFLTKIDKYFIQEVKKLSNIMELNNEFDCRVEGIISIRFFNQNNQLLLKKASEYFAASTGSACSNSNPSYVLKEIGLSDQHIRESIRFSLSKFNTIEEIKEFIKLFDSV